MMPGPISKRVAADRLAWVERMVAAIRALPLDDRAAFFADARNVWTAESCLRRALEALLDLGRHVLAKGFGQGTTEYKEIATKAAELGILSPEDAARLRQMAGYRNRLVHFYHEVKPDELYQICATDLNDIEQLAAAFRQWLTQHSAELDEEL